MKVQRVIKAIRRLDVNLSRLRDPARRKVLVNARTSMNYSVIAPIYREMRHDSRIQFYFMSSEEPDRVRDIYREGNGDLRFIGTGLAAMTRFDAYLAADLLWPPLPRGTRRVLMFHGVAGKYSGVYDRTTRSMRDWHRLFFINRRRLRNLVRSGAIDEHSTAACLIGMPKIDCLVDGTLERNHVLKVLGLDSTRPTVLYAPTWSPYSSLNKMGEKLVRLLCESGYTVIVKLHDRSLYPEFIHSGGVDWPARLRPILQRPHGCLAHGSDSSPYLAAADVLITDHSSVGFEYMLLDRPVVRIEAPELIDRTDVNRDYVDLIVGASITVRNAVEALKAVEEALSDPRRQSARRRAVAEELFYRPGTATERAVRTLYSVLELDPAESPAQERAPVFQS